MGYGKTNEGIYKNIALLAESGVAGINIEDSQINKSKRTLQAAESFAKKLDYIKTHLQRNNISLFINVRCDTYILNVENKERETKKRAKLYESSGADGLFLPCIVKDEDIQSAIASTSLPLNVMAIPGLPGFEKLNQLGIKRVSPGRFPV